jgi:uncharacterized protein
MLKQKGLICIALLSSILLSVKSAEAKPSSAITNPDSSIAAFDVDQYQIIVSKAIAQATPASSTQISPEKKRLLLELMEMTGSKKNYEQTQQLMVAQIQQQVAAISGRSDGQDVSKFIKELYQKFTYEQMLERVLYPTYDQYFSEEDIKGMIDFYKTPTGAKVISVTPQLSQTLFKRTFEVINPHITEIIGKIKK